MGWPLCTSSSEGPQSCSWSLNGGQTLPGGATSRPLPRDPGTSIQAPLPFLGSDSTSSGSSSPVASCWLYDCRLWGFPQMTTAAI